MIHVLPPAPAELAGPALDPLLSQGIDAARLQEQRHLSLIIDSAPNGMILVDGSGVIELVNKQVEKMFGYGRSELLGKSVELLLPERYRERHPSLRGGYHREPNARAMGVGRDLFGRRKDGSEFALEIGLNPIPTTAGTWVLSSVVDITERKLVEAKMLETARLKSQFLANMSHEIRTPMNVIIGMSNVLLETMLSAEQREYSQMIANGAESLLTIVNDILDFSKIEAGKLEITSHEFDLNTAVEEAAGFLAESAGRKGIELTCQSGPAAPLTRGDGLRIRQILINILGNAVKFTERGEVNLTMTWEPMAREPKDTAGLLARFEVRDSGIGMSTETLTGLFEPFSQGDGSLTRRYGGTGLGLAISKKLVDLMGGQIGARSEAGQGSTFWFTVPLEISADQESKQPALYSSLAGCRALVVDDSESNRKILAAQMGYWSLDVTTANGAAEGLALLRTGLAGNRPYDVILLDYKMPGINGLDMARILRADPALAATPIFLLTSYCGRKIYEEATQAGVDMQMTKPVRSHQLHDALGRLLTEPRKAPVSPTTSRTAGTEGHHPARKSGKVLLVEDNAGNRQVALTLLDRLGYACDVAVNGTEALAAVRSQNYKLVLMDLQMPNMDGIEATSAIREFEGNKRSIRIIAMTANAMVGDRERCLAAGMDDYLAKPFRPRELDDMMNRWMDVEEEL